MRRNMDAKITQPIELVNAAERLTPPARPRGDADFPSTRSDWIAVQLMQGEPGRREVMHHIFESYAAPLERYLHGSSYRSAGNPHELVQGFLADRLPRAEFFVRWIDSDLPLRRWLMNGFLFYLRETVRKEQRFPSLLETDLADDRQEAHRSFEREWGTALVERALERARKSCERRGQELHWELLVRHYLHGVPYATLIEVHGISAKEAATMVRTAAGKLRKAIFEQLDRDGIPECDIDSEIMRLMEAMRP